MAEVAEGREVDVAEEAAGGTSTEATVDEQHLTITFYSCGDGGCDNRQFTALDPTNVYQQLAMCLASPDPRDSTNGKHAYPQVEVSAAYRLRTYGVEEAIQVFDGLPEGSSVDKIYFIGHGTGRPPAYFFSGCNRERVSRTSRDCVETRDCLSRLDFWCGDWGSLFLLGYEEFSIPWDDDLVNYLNTSQDDSDNLRFFRETYADTTFADLRLNGEHIEIEREYRDRQWVLRDDQSEYYIRARESEGTRDLQVLARNTPLLRNCHDLVDAMKRRLVPNAHIGFLSCFSGGDRGYLVDELHRLITEEDPRIAGVTVGAYRDYFEFGYTQLDGQRIVEWHNRIVNSSTDEVIGGREARGRCGEDIIPQYQETAPDRPLVDADAALPTDDTDDILGGQ